MLFQFYMIILQIEYISLFNQLDTWRCQIEELQCGSGTPVCVSSYAVCDGIEDCIDGKDEDAELCGECCKIKIMKGI